MSERSWGNFSPVDVHFHLGSMKFIRGSQIDAAGRTLVYRAAPLLRSPAVKRWGSLIMRAASLILDAGSDSPCGARPPEGDRVPNDRTTGANDS